MFYEVCLGFIRLVGVDIVGRPFRGTHERCGYEKSNLGTEEAFQIR
jgi:hypothetical protein